MYFSLFKPSLNVFKFIVRFNILHKKGHMCLTIQKTSWILCGYFILDYDVQMSSEWLI
jgi:hypothetical protein